MTLLFVPKTPLPCRKKIGRSMPLRNLGRNI